MSKDKVFEFLVSIFLWTGEMGHYDENKRLICLYDIKKERAETIKEGVKLITNNARVIILDPDDEITNINILDIGI